jgi:hypothetical protein
MGKPTPWYRRLASGVVTVLLERGVYDFDKETLLSLQWFFGWLQSLLAVVCIGYAVHLGDWSFGRSTFFISAAVLWGGAGAFGIWRVRRVRRRAGKH